MTSDFQYDIVIYITEFVKFNGWRGNKPYSGTYEVCSLVQGFQRLVNRLSSAKAQSIRDQIGKIYVRYMAGDQTLEAEIQANRLSTNPVNVICREAIAGEAIVLGKRPAEIVIQDDYRMVFKRYDGMVAEYKEEKAELKEEIKSLKVEMKKREAELKEQLVKREAEQKTAMEELINKHKQDLMMKDILMENALSKERGRPIKIGEVIHRVKPNWKNNQADLFAIGEMVKNEFILKMECAAEKGERLYAQGSMTARIYYMKDWYLIDTCVRRHFGMFK